MKIAAQQNIVFYVHTCTCVTDALYTAAAAPGAGWGGCTVSLVREADAPKFIAALREQYYAPLVAQGVVKEEDLGECLFASKPSSGAALMKLKLASLEQPAEAPTQPAAAPAEQEAVMYEI